MQREKVHCSLQISALSPVFSFNKGLAPSNGVATIQQEIVSPTEW